jgi:mono/diheme cytochrome c family protein
MKRNKAGNEAGADFNVREIHGQIWREHAEPTERYRAMPWWLKHGIYAPLVLWALWYLIVYSGGFDSNEYYEGYGKVPYHLADDATMPGPPVAAATGPANREKEGEKVYAAVCSSCHQPNGAGLAGAFPPLAGSDWVAGKPEILAATVLHGLSGPIQVNGISYNGAMPPWGATLSDDDVANVLTYIRSTWGNSAAAVDPGLVASIRKDHPARAPWTEEELRKTFPD